MDQASMATRGKQISTEIDRAYAAGVLDADGSICISKAKPETLMKAVRNDDSRVFMNPRYVVYVNVVNTSELLMHWLCEKFGGRYGKRKMLKPDRQRQTYDWKLQNNGCEPFIRLVLPYLQIKKDRAKLALRFWDEAIPYPKGKGARLPQEEVDRREFLYCEMKGLNQVGVVQPQRLSPEAPPIGG